MVESSKKVAPWRKAVADAVFTRYIETGDDTSFTEAVEIWATFFIPRPPSVKRIWPHIPPDLDKLERGLFDAITLTGLWADDSLVVRSHAVKYYADVHAAGNCRSFRAVNDQTNAGRGKVRGLQLGPHIRTGGAVITGAQ
jgi:Holliday junction resolvase RusA-like endonuclease